MELNVFKNNVKLLQILQQAKEACNNKEFSDIVDAQGNQYVDLVMEGGGMLGIALVGYTYVLEQVGIRFLGIGGTSAGAINALLVAALAEPGKPKGEKLLVELANKDFFDFVDGDSDARDLIESWINGAGNIKLAFKAAQVIDNLQNDLGLNPGNAFTEWLRKVLEKEGIVDFASLKKRMQTVPEGLKLRSGKSFENPAEQLFRLAVIAADVTTETKVEFPRMAEFYWNDVDGVNPALFVRASMSIPYFFQPMKVKRIPKGPEAENRWEALASYHIAEEGRLPSEVLFIDGGIMSNFPIDVFHNTKKVPSAPTFGVKLELDKRLTSIDGPLNLLGTIFNAARHTLDYDFIHRNPDYSKLVTWIPAKGYNWLDFNMSDEKKLGLFLEGANCAAKFLSTFNWSEYKTLRAFTAKEAEVGNV
ncbi:patatin-like phospholipase family protein [Pseudomonas izuensis]|uniref:patatin-like phospholipase family protein n=1 Tax=Pseudomonas izuensis TaxID=2684212 RepID=UPI00135B64C8|nr:patatin-like phospholipase family protein [Pseudomonas izuensis]